LQISIENYQLTKLCKMCILCPKNQFFLSNVFITRKMIIFVHTCSIFKYWKYITNNAEGKSDFQAPFRVSDSLIIIAHASIWSTMLYLVTVYSLFSACEYLLVFTNIAFHATTCIDFDGTVNTIAPKELIEERISKRNN